MAANGCGPEEAFEILVRASQRENVRLCGRSPDRRRTTSTGLVVVIQLDRAPLSRRG